jgi:hypothetical protein
LSGAIAKPVSINLQKLVLSPTDSINLGFLLREDLLLCLSYLPLGVPNWAVNYTPSGLNKIDRILISIRYTFFSGSSSEKNLRLSVLDLERFEDG